MTITRNRASLTMIKDEPFNAEAPHSGLAGHTTPTELHYVRSNFALPDHGGTLTVGGAVDRPLTLTVDDLRSLPAVTQAVTLECAGNGRLDMRPLPTGEPWGGYAVSTAVWTGARLADVLSQAGPRADGVELRCQGADHGKYHLASVLEPADADLSFVRSLALPHASDPAADILIAYEMNGEPLQPDHGAPFRLVVPHWYAVASVKWLERLDVITEPFTGEFQTGHYVYQWPDRPSEPVTLMRIRARITDPQPGAFIPAGTHMIHGKAWSGAGPITEVGLSFTGESEWAPATVEPPRGPYQWQDWSFRWEATPGRHSIRARARDAAGNVQPEVPPWNRLGYGNNAVELSYVEVR
ncbi:sulfite oxidase [Paractinoplanes atraurantiacus]|uniref:Mo-co oxidoreductase dimerisation domain-containing protein n=1 Tax=Paractinoplanes atraurantiacus TaxID=1036182 RepID=A0A285J1G0_9ACTN|nr:sulfite oxidase [Actinoplanes atraurantiacus]SNY52971.1 Mo-co oxidoreductase dimerisation domain-containing protein [Actinoplanes atraurantiacus]